MLIVATILLALSFFITIYERRVAVSPPHDKPMIAYVSGSFLFDLALGSITRGLMVVAAIIVSDMYTWHYGLVVAIGYLAYSHLVMRAMFNRQVDAWYRQSFAKYKYANTMEPDHLLKVTCRLRKEAAETVHQWIKGPWRF